MAARGGGGLEIGWIKKWGEEDAPTALLSMISWALTLAAEDMAGVTLEAKIRRRNEMVGGRWGGC